MVIIIILSRVNIMQETSDFNVIIWSQKPKVQVQKRVLPRRESFFIPNFCQELSTSAKSVIIGRSLWYNISLKVGYGLNLSS